MLEIAQFTHDIRYKPGKANLQADELSRPKEVPPGDAYCPQFDTIAACKKLITNELKPEEIRKAQAHCPNIKNYLQGRKSPNVHLVEATFDGIPLLCESSKSKPRPIIPQPLVQNVLQACHNLDHCGQRESLNRAATYYFWPKMEL